MILASGILFFSTLTVGNIRRIRLTLVSVMTMWHIPLTGFIGVRPRVSPLSAERRMLLSALCGIHGLRYFMLMCVVPSTMHMASGSEPGLMFNRQTLLSGGQPESCCVWMMRTAKTMGRFSSSPLPITTGSLLACFHIFVLNITTTPTVLALREWGGRWVLLNETRLDLMGRLMKARRSMISSY